MTDGTAGLTELRTPACTSCRRACDRHRRRSTASSPSSSSGQLRQAGFERARAGAVGWPRLGARRLPRSPRRSVRETLLCVLMPYRTSSPASRGDAEAVVARPRLRSPSWSTSADRRRLLRWSAGPTARGGQRAATGQLHGRAPRMAVLYDRSVTWGGLVVGTGNKTESLHRLHDHLRRQRLRVQPDRRPVQEPGPPARAADRRAGADRPQGPVGRPVAGPDGRDRRLGFTYPLLDRLLFWRVDKRRSTEELVAARLRSGRSSTASTAWSPAPSSSARCRRSPSSGRAPPGVDYLYPRRRPGSSAAVNRRTVRRDAAGGTLYVVATPIGNLGDITLRALEILRAVPLDRGRGHAHHAQRLLRRARDRDADHQLPRRSGPGRHDRRCSSTFAPAQDLALVTDAGTPVVSDPGADLVAAWAAEGGRVVPIPGASAVLAAVVASRHRRAALELRGLPAAERPRPSRAARADRRRRAGHDRVRGAEPRRRDPSRPRRGLRCGPSRRRSAAS